MAQKPNVQRTPLRALTEYTVGVPDRKPSLSTAASSPNIGTLTSTPRTAIVCGLDTQTAQQTTLAVGAGAFGSTTVVIPMPNFPAGFQGSPNDKIFFYAEPFNIAFSVAVILSTVAVTPQGFSEGVTYPGPLLQPGLAFQSFNVSIALQYYAPGAVGAGTVTVSCAGRLYDLPG